MNNCFIEWLLEVIVTRTTRSHPNGLGCVKVSDKEKISLQAFEVLVKRAVGM